MSPQKPTLIFVPGLWEGPAVFTAVMTALQSHGYPTFTAALASTGHKSPPLSSSSASSPPAAPTAPTMHDDVAAIRSVVEKHVSASNGSDVILICHSAGGFLGSGATKDLTVRARREKGLKGGVRKFVFLTAGLLPVGVRHPEVLPFYDVKDDGAVYCASPAHTLFNDLPPSVTSTWLPKLQCQPATGWAAALDYAGWTEAPSVYVICEADNALPVEVQEQMVGLLKSAGVEPDVVVERCGAGHMVMLSQPEVVVGVVRRAAGEEGV